MEAEGAARRCREIADTLWDFRKELGRHPGQIPPSMSASLLAKDCNDLHIVGRLLGRLPQALKNARSAKPPGPGFWDIPLTDEDPRRAAYRQAVRETLAIIEVDLED